MAKLQSQLEQGEAKCQTLEVDLAVAKKKSNEFIRSTTIQEASMSNENKRLLGKIFCVNNIYIYCKLKLFIENKSSLETKVEDLEKALQIARRVTMEDEKRIAFLVDEKVYIIFCYSFIYVHCNCLSINLKRTD